MNHTGTQFIKTYVKSKFTLLLIALILMILLVPYSNQYDLGPWALKTIYTLIVISAVLVLRHTRFRLIFFASLAGINIVFNFLELLYGGKLLALIDSISFGLFCGLFLSAIFTEVLSTRRITQDTIYGAICIYLLIGITYATAYGIIEIITPGAFIHTGNPPQAMHGFNLLYFSFITLTTVGFGDIVAVSSQAKSIVILESISGIFYLAILVARLVGMRSR